eukprot:6905864-Prymnesium_polylepis.2
MRVDPLVNLFHGVAQIRSMERIGAAHANGERRIRLHVIGLHVDVMRSRAQQMRVEGSGDRREDKAIRGRGRAIGNEDHSDPTKRSALAAPARNDTGTCNRIGRHCCRSLAAGYRAAAALHRRPTARRRQILRWARRIAEGTAEQSLAAAASSAPLCSRRPAQRWTRTACALVDPRFSRHRLGSGGSIAEHATGRPASSGVARTGSRATAHPCDRPRRRS